MEDSRLIRAALVAIALFTWLDGLSAQTASDEPRVARLVKTLGADDFAARRAADLELLKLGQEGRRQLEAAAQSADPEIRLRALNLLERMAVVRLWEPSRVTLQRNDHVSNLFASIASQSNNHVFAGASHSDYNNLAVDIQQVDVPYWQAVDTLARQSDNHIRLHYDSRLSGIVVAAGAAGKFPTAYAGPVRAQVTSARRTFVEDFDHEADDSEVTHTFQLNLQMLWEDRFRLAAYCTEPEVVEVKTDTGAFLGAPQSSADAWNVASPSTRQVSASLKLNPPPTAATELSVLRLKWNLVALGDMAIAEIANPAANSELHQDGFYLKILAYNRQTNGRIEIRLLIAREIAAADPPEIQFQENTIELLAADAEPLKCQSQTHTLTNAGVEFNLAFNADRSQSTPEKLRVTYPKFRSRRNLEIIFTDVPLPAKRPE
jgi:hypothetical protein